MELDLLNILLVLLAALLGGRIAIRFGYPAVLGEILAGILLGPPLIGLLYETPGVIVLAELGVLLMMLFIGMQIDPRELGRASRAGLLAALGGFVVPFGLGYAAAIALGGTSPEAIFVALAMGATSLLTKSRILVDLKILDTRIAHVMMAGTLMSDTLSLVLFAGVISVTGTGSVIDVGLALVVLKVALFFAAAWFLGLRVFPAFYRSLHRQGLTGRTLNITLVVLIAITFGELAQLAGLHAIVGTFVAGLMLREAIRSQKLAFELTEVVRDVSLGFLAPLFFVTAGFLVTLDVFQTDLTLLLSVIVLATIGKIIGTALFYLPSGHGWREGVTVGIGMTGRGAVEILIAEIGLEAGIIDRDVYSVLVFMAIATTATTPLFFKWGVDWLSRRGELVRSDGGRRGVVIVGAGPLARILARELKANHEVRLVDRNAANVQEAELEGLSAVHGDALDPSVLREVGIERAGTLVAVTPNASVNVLAAQRARNEFLVGDVRAALIKPEHGGLFSVLEGFGGRPLFTIPVDIASLDQHLAERTMLGLAHDIRAVDARRITKIDTKEALPLTVRRDGAVRLFTSWRELQPGDEVVVLPMS